MKIIILAPADDNHTAPIKWGLEKRATKWSAGPDWAGP